MDWTEVLLVTCDVGNTHTVIGTFENPDATEPARTWRIATRADQTGDELSVLLRQLLGVEDLQKEVNGLAVSSVVTRASAAWTELARKYLGDARNLIISTGYDTGLKIDVDRPAEVGADRVVNCVAAMAKYGAPFIVIDFGTATTFDAVDTTETLVGGVIVPGIEISMEALAQRASALSRIEFVRPPSVLGKNTANQVQAGLFVGQAGMIDGICQDIKQHIGEAMVIATGGLANLIAPHTPVIDVHDSWLTLYGLKLLYDRADS